MKLLLENNELKNPKVAKLEQKTFRIRFLTEGML